MKISYSPLSRGQFLAALFNLACDGGNKISDSEAEAEIVDKLGLATKIGGVRVPCEEGYIDKIRGVDINVYLYAGKMVDASGYKNGKVDKIIEREARRLYEDSYIEAMATVKQIICKTISGCFLLCAFNLCAQTQVVNNVVWRFSLKNGEAVLGGDVIGNNNKLPAVDDPGDVDVLEIPSELGGCPVTEIGVVAFQFNHTIGTVIIPASVKRINKVSFVRALNGMDCLSCQINKVLFLGEQPEVMQLSRKDDGLWIEQYAFGFATKSLSSGNTLYGNFSNAQCYYIKGAEGWSDNSSYCATWTSKGVTNINTHVGSAKTDIVPVNEVQTNDVVLVTISSNNDGAQILYSVGEGESYVCYDGAFELQLPNVVRAKSVVDKYPFSVVTERVYARKAKSPLIHSSKGLQFNTSGNVIEITVVPLGQ